MEYKAECGQLNLSHFCVVCLCMPVCLSPTVTVSMGFYPRDAMLARVIEIATCLSVCPSVRASVRHAPVLCQNEES